MMPPPLGRAQVDEWLKFGQSIHILLGSVASRPLLSLGTLRAFLDPAVMC